jgi:hypothetical protein
MCEQIEKTQPQPRCKFLNDNDTCSHDDAPKPNESECIGGVDCGVRMDADIHKVEVE